MKYWIIFILASIFAGLFGWAIMELEIVFVFKPILAGFSLIASFLLSALTVDFIENVIDSIKHIKQLKEQEIQEKQYLTKLTGEFYQNVEDYSLAVYKAKAKVISEQKEELIKLLESDIKSLEKEFERTKIRLQDKELLLKEHTKEKNTDVN